jgi:hypothetical protein
LIVSVTAVPQSSVALGLHDTVTPVGGVHAVPAVPGFPAVPAGLTRL